MMEIKRANVTQQVVEYLERNIVDGSWSVGEKIPSENMLTELLGVSRTSVRVAIRQLIGIGALESIHGKGTFVKTNDLRPLLSPSSNSITAEDCRDMKKVLEFRAILEPETCYLATTHITDERVNELRYHLEKMIQAIGNKEDFVRHDIMFHEHISKGCGNHLLEKSLREVFEQTIIHKQINEVFGYKDGVYYHKLILKAIEEKKATQARKLMREHIRQALDRL